MDVLPCNRNLFEIFETLGGELLDDRPDELLRRRGAGGEADRLMAREQLVGEVALSVDEAGGRAGRPGHLDEALGVRARRRPDHENERRVLRDLLDRILAILRRVADVV